MNIDTTAPATTATGLQAERHGLDGDHAAERDAWRRPTPSRASPRPTTRSTRGGQPDLWRQLQRLGPGTHAMVYWSVDAAGNAETTTTGYVNIDTTAPVTTAGGLAADRTSSWHLGPASFTLNATTPVRRGHDELHHRWRRHRGLRGRGGVRQRRRQPRDHLVVDRCGRQRRRHPYGYLNIDATAPDTSATNLAPDAGSGWTNATPQSVTLSATDSGSGMSAGGAVTYYRIDSSGSYSTYGGALSVATAGSHKIDYYSADVAGNSESVKTGYVNIDTTAPTTAVAGADSAWHASDVPLAFSADDHGLSGVAYTEYRVDPVDDSASWTTGSAVTVPTSLGDGVHTVQYRSLDDAGNVEGTKSCTVKIDTVAPATTAGELAEDRTSDWRRTAASFTLTATDAASGAATTKYEVDGEGAELYTGGPVLVSGDASHIVTYWSTDTAGNVEDTHTAYLNIDAMAPTTTGTNLAPDDASGWTRTTPQTVTSSHGRDVGHEPREPRHLLPHRLQRRLRHLLRAAVDRHSRQP